VRSWLRSASLEFFGVIEEYRTAADREVIRVLNTGGGFGATTVPTEVAGLVLNLMQVYGAWRTLGVVPLDTGKTKVAQISTEPYAAWITPSNNGAAALIAGSITGTSTDTDCPTIAALLEVARPLLEDNKTSFEGALLEALVTALNKAADRACFVSDGTDDAVDGLQTGIFAHSGVVNYVAGTGRILAASLALVDFAGAIGSVNTAALARACHWWINPAFLPKLMLISDNDEKILKPPTTPGGQWMLAGFPVVWTPAAPAVDDAGAQIAAFGRGEAYLFAIARNVELRKTETQERAFTSNLSLLRATMRAQAKMQDASSFAILRTAAA
jgi:HK97 family phage major capsid protein